MLKVTLAILAVVFVSQNSFALECIGTEPFWSATLTEKSMKLSDPVKVSKTAITKVSTAAGMAPEFIQVYSNVKGPVAVVKTAECSDGMSENLYPQEVVIFRPDVVLYGCCGEPTKVEE